VKGEKGKLWPNTFLRVELITTLATARESHEVCWKMYEKRQSDGFLESSSDSGLRACDSPSLLCP
jgi:hypothetical protein